MSEYQVYEFVAVDRPLTPKEMTELRAISTRAEISPTRLRNEYHWGSLKADPQKLLARYFDVHLYAASSGERRLLFRLPASQVDIAALRPYLGDQGDVLTRTGGHYILELTSDSDDFEPDDEDPEIGDMAGWVSLRAGLLQGDMRVPYLAWLLAVQGEHIPDSAREPPVPAGLCPLPGPLAALADFLGLDDDLLRVAAEASAAERRDPDALRRWIAGLSPKDKDQWLLRSVEQPERPLGPELLAAHRRATTSHTAGERTAGQLRARAEVVAEIAEREAQAAAARQAKRLAEARRKRLEALARAPGVSWPKLEELVAARNYDDAVALAVDLHDAALERRQTAEFLASMAALKQRQSSRRGFFTELRRQLARRPESERIEGLR